MVVEHVVVEHVVVVLVVVLVAAAAHREVAARRRQTVCSSLLCVRVVFQGTGSLTGRRMSNKNASIAERNDQRRARNASTPAAKRNERRNDRIGDEQTDGFKHIVRRLRRLLCNSLHSCLCCRTKITGFPAGTSANELIAFLHSNALAKLTIVESGFQADGALFVVVDTHKESLALQKLSHAKFNGAKLFVKQVSNGGGGGGKLQQLFVRFVEQNYDATAQYLNMASLRRAMPRLFLFCFFYFPVSLLIFSQHRRQDRSQRQCDDESVVCRHQTSLSWRADAQSGQQRHSFLVRLFSFARYIDLLSTFFSSITRLFKRRHQMCRISHWRTTTSLITNK